MKNVVWVQLCDVVISESVRLRSVKLAISEENETDLGQLAVDISNTFVNLSHPPASVVT